jgi:hypothetical protein
MKTIGFLGMIGGIFGVPATTRNWNTIMATVEVLRNPSSFATGTITRRAQR